MKNFLPHFPLTSAYYELEDAPGHLGHRFQTEIVPMGQLKVTSGRLAIGDPLLGMASGSNRWLPIPSGSYAVLLTRLFCLDKAPLSLPSYLSLVLDADLVTQRRQRQGGADETDYPQVENCLMSTLEVNDEGVFVEAETPEESEASLLVKSGVVAFVDENAFGRRMPNPLEIEGGWFERFFDSQSRDSWVKLLDDEEHIAAGAANIPLPEGPDDWDETPPTIAIVQMIGPREARVYLEYDRDDHRRLAPIAVHIELGLRDE